MTNLAIGSLIVGAFACGAVTMLVVLVVLADRLKRAEKVEKPEFYCPDESWLASATVEQIDEYLDGFRLATVQARRWRYRKGGTRHDVASPGSDSATW